MRSRSPLVPRRAAGRRAPGFVRCCGPGTSGSGRLDGGAACGDGDVRIHGRRLARARDVGADPPARSTSSPRPSASGRCSTARSRLIEGRGYEADGTTSFNAFAILSYDVATKSFRMRSYAMGRSGDYPVQRTADGFAWEIPAGPMTIRYNAMVQGRHLGRDRRPRHAGPRPDPLLRDAARAPGRQRVAGRRRGPAEIARPRRHRRAIA